MESLYLRGAHEREVDINLKLRGALAYQSFISEFKIWSNLISRVVSSNQY